MNCKEAQHQLRTISPAHLAADTGLQTHLANCDECGAMGRDLELIRLLADAPVPPSSHGFADRALAHAWETAHGRPARVRRLPFAGAGLAACVALAGIFWFQQAPRDSAAPAAVTVVQVAPQAAHPVHIRLVSKEALPDATIKILWDKNLALEGYSTTNSLSWRSPLAAGVNQLTLPVLAGALSGEIVIEVSAKNARKTLRFRVEPRSLAHLGGRVEYSAYLI